MTAIVIITVIVAAWFVLRNSEPRYDETSAQTPSKPSANVPPRRVQSAQTTLVGPDERMFILATLPLTFDRAVTVPSHSERGKTYDVNLGQLTCTCEDFQKRRASLPAQDLRRICKHLGRSLEEAKVLSQYDEVAQAFIRPKKATSNRSVHRGVSAERFIEIHDGADRLVLAFTSGNPWVDVVTRRGTKNRVQKYKRYSYNVDEDRWSYGSAPYSEWEVREAIEAHI